MSEEAEVLGEAGKKALDDLRRERKDLEGQLKHYKKRLMEHEDLKPEQFAELKAQLEERDAQYKQLQDKYTKDTSGLNQELSQLRASYEESVINQAVSQHFYGAGGRKGTGDIPPDSFFTMFAPQVKGRIKLIDGKPTVIDAAGSPQTKDGKPVGMNDLMQEMKAGAGGIFFDSSSPGGSGTRPGAGLPVNGKVDVMAMSPAERIEYGRKMGQ